MKTFLYLCALLLTLAGCRTTKPDRAAGTDPTGPYVPVVVRPDSLSGELVKVDEPTAKLDSVVVTPHRSLVDKVLRRHSTSPTTSYHKPGSIIPQVGKKSTVSIYYGPATVTTTTVGKKATAATAEGATATSIEKAKAPVATGTGDATDQSGTGAASTIKGNNNAPVLTNTAPAAPGVGATIAAAIATPVGKVLAALLLASVGYGVYRLWPLLRKKPTDTTA